MGESWGPAGTPGPLVPPAPITLKLFSKVYGRVMPFISNLYFIGFNASLMVFGKYLFLHGRKKKLKKKSVDQLQICSKRHRLTFALKELSSKAMVSGVVVGGFVVVVVEILILFARPKRGKNEKGN